VGWREESVPGVVRGGGGLWRLRGSECESDGHRGQRLRRLDELGERRRLRGALPDAPDE
jgi:hypothetical protein